MQMLSHNIAENYYLELTKQGHLVFSPIMYNHQFHVDMKKKFENIGKVFVPPDYVALDLEMIKAFMNGNGHLYKWTTDHCPKCGEELKWKRTRHEVLECCDVRYDKVISFPGVTNVYDTEVHEKMIYDSGVAMLMEKQAYEIDENGTKHWLSDGCRQEYEFAEKNFIRVIDLAEFREGNKVDV